MDYNSYKNLVYQIDVGKKLPDAVYLHISALDTLPKALSTLLERILKGLKIPKDSWNIIKFVKKRFSFGAFELSRL